ncbi:MAG: acyl-[acyl-carrier-protein] thioesterase [Candidatus Scatomorpha sp.]
MEKEYAMRPTDFDKFSHIKPSAVLELFQDAAGQHSEEIGVGFEAMLERSYLWVLTRIKFKVLYCSTSCQKVIIKTWPLVPNRFNYRREYCIENENGEKLIIGSSDWVVVHSEKRQLLSVPDLYSFSDGFHSKKMFEERIAKIQDFEAEGTPYVVTAGFSDMDTNDHVNNTKYANYVLDAINPSKSDELEIFQIDYRKEVLQGTQLKIYHIKEENLITAKGQNQNGDTMFICKLEYKKIGENAL